MKNMRVVIKITICLLFLVGLALGQIEKNVQEPDFIGVFFQLDAEGKLNALERQTPEVKSKVKGLGWGGAESMLQIKGEKSPIRFKSDQKLEFVVRVASQTTDPISILEFITFEINKGYRRIIIVKVGAVGTSVKSSTNQYMIPFNATKYGAFSFKMSPVNQLKAGEYCLSGKGIQDGFCFGIDVAEADKNK